MLTLVSNSVESVHGNRGQKLDLTIGDLVEVGGRRYEVVADRAGGLTLEPPITPVSDLYAERGWKPASEDDFKRLTADGEPADGER